VRGCDLLVSADSPLDTGGKVLSGDLQTQYAIATIVTRAATAMSPVCIYLTATDLLRTHLITGNLAQLHGRLEY
jgi:hypothetical protein